MRTTPERSKRLKLSLENMELREDAEKLSHDYDRLRKLWATTIWTVASIPAFFLIAHWTKALSVSAGISMPANRGDFFAYAGAFAVFFTLMITLIWSEKIQDQLVKTFRKRKRQRHISRKEKNS
jgi:hypothetical protein